MSLYGTIVGLLMVYFNELIYLQCFISLIGLHEAKI